MSVSRAFERIVRAATRRPLVVVVVAGLLALVGGLLALRLQPNADPDTLVDRDSQTFKATDRYHRLFGDDAILILVRGPLTRLVLTQDVERLLGLEGCISGNLPAGSTPPGGSGGPCARLAQPDFKPVKVVYGPGTFINEAVRQLQEQFTAQQRDEAVKERRASQAAHKLAAAKGFSKARQDKLAGEARQLVRARFLRDVLRLALNYGIRSVPRLNDPAFVSTLVFDPTRGAGVPKARFAYLFPNRNSALVQVRLRPDLSTAQRAKAIALIKDAVRMPQWQLHNGGRYTITGAPVVLDALTRSITHSIIVLLIAAVLVMAATLALVFSSRLRLLPLGVALAATGATFGGMKLAGVSLTMAAIAVLPVLIGLGVDYAIQLQSRFDEQVGGRVTGSEAAARTAALGAPTIGAACLATAAGFAVLLLSPVPMVRGFGILLVIGIGLAFAFALSAGFAALAMRDGGRSVPQSLSRLFGLLGPSLRGAGELLATGARRVGAQRALGVARTHAGALARGALAQATARPGRVLAVGAALAVAGLALDTQTKVVSDVSKLVPQNLGALRDLTSLQRATGVSGEIDVTVRANDLTDPSVVAWMGDYQQGLLRRYRYSPKRPCGQAQLCPALSLPDLFRTSGASADRSRIRALLAAVPPYFSQAVITRDRRVATLAFGIRLMPLDQQQRVIDEMRRQLHPPAGVHAELAGLPVLAAEANAKVSAQWRRMLTLVAGLAAVALVLLAVYRRPQRALIPLIPIALASGWSALLLFLIRIPLNPMSVTLGALVIAISTEFSVLLSERYRQERARGAPPAAALASTYRSTGRAVLASGTTAIAGFAVLIFSSIRMLRDFGIVTVVDLSVSLAGVMVVLPAVLLLAERGELADLPLRALRRARRLLPRPRRATA